MSANSTASKKNKVSKQIISTWKKLTWDDLDEWAGSRSVTRGKSYQRQGRVQQLCVSKVGVLLAWVQGNKRYATSVLLDMTKRKRSSRILSECSCPVGSACKHGVAVVVEYLNSIEDNNEVEIAEDDDSRWAIIEGSNEHYEDELDDEWDEDDEIDETSYALRKSAISSQASGMRTKASAKRRKKITDSDIQSYLESKPHDELVQLLMQICGRDAEVRKALADDTALADGRFDELLREARAEMRSLTGEDAWCNSWTGEGHLPNYSGLEKRLKTLLDYGYADAIVDLGQELIQRGIEQINRSHDEGETCCEIATCMEVVGEALLKSTRRDEEKILYAIDTMLVDDFDMCEKIGSVIDKRWKKSVWSTVANRLHERLDKQSPPLKDRDNWNRSYRRDRLSDWLIKALDNAGRSEEATKVCVDEARQVGSYKRAVRRLLAEKQLDSAEQLALEGLEATSPTYAGIIHELQNLLSDIAAKKKDWMLPAAIAADRFFCRPSVGSYRDLLKAAKKANCESVVQQAALAFLETGQRPDRDGSRKTKRKPSSSWPLPAPPKPQEKTSRVHLAHMVDGPHFDVLIDLAIDEKRSDDVLKWYDQQKSSVKNGPRPWQSRVSRGDARIAKAVEKAHPDRAITIYQQLADSIASETNTRTYPEAGRYLKRIKPLLKKAGRKNDWNEIIAEFRAKHGRKPRLMQVIDGITGRPIARKRKS